MNSLNLRDAQVKSSRVMPSAASTAVTSAGIDLMNGTTGNFCAPCDALVTAPALTTTMLPDTRTMTYDIVHSVNSDMSSPATLYSAVITQTGAASAGAAATTFRASLPRNVRRYVALKVTSGASTTDASTLTAYLELLF